MLSSEVRAVRLPKRPRGMRGLGREGFDAREVDDLLERCADALETYEKGGREVSLRGDEIVLAQFRHTRFGDAYLPDPVDAYLDEIVVALRRYEQE